MRLTKGSQTFEFFGKIKSLYDQLRRLCIQFNFSKKYTIKKLIAKGTFATVIFSNYYRYIMQNVNLHNMNMQLNVLKRRVYHLIRIKRIC